MNFFYQLNPTVSLRALAEVEFSQCRQADDATIRVTLVRFLSKMHAMDAYLTKNRGFYSIIRSTYKSFINLVLVLYMAAFYSYNSHVEKILLDFKSKLALASFVLVNDCNNFKNYYLDRATLH